MPSLPKMNIPVSLGAYETNWYREFRDPQWARPPPEFSVTPVVPVSSRGHVKGNHLKTVAIDGFSAYNITPLLIPAYCKIKVVRSVW